ncbi:translation initiation factor eIF4E [Schizosaccharomyces japonicus yFS275]|uniref:Translation initiation factor eIF4E n=1 Tax=Schizosaccharomyces japonicus (strain yFS275 / FY16936) TaxID=402676 RepID=B6JVU1_SCHJY|nr:translation initiation factor eIF4E [Schizosaccharomyces japonicus yFS275]EEB05492.2 translation initiation factor eIF4E [Schizosaccharomyces japonicus yFS275]
MQVQQAKEEHQNLNEAPKGALRTVFNDRYDFNVKHPLTRAWTLWFLMPPTPGLEWNELQKNVMTFKSVEEFWGIQNNIHTASSLPIKSDYSFFREGVRPEWEDVHNKNGGKWAFQNKGRGGAALDEMWLNTNAVPSLSYVSSYFFVPPSLSFLLLTLPGFGRHWRESDPTGEEVMGVVINMRKGFYRLAVWTKTCSNREVLMEIGTRFKQALNLPRNETIEFSAHEDSSKSGSTRAKTRMSL